jgi:hypothetical protein
LTLEGMQGYTDNIQLKAMEHLVSLQNKEQEIDKLKAETAKLDAERRFLHYKKKNGFK